MNYSSILHKSKKSYFSLKLLLLKLKAMFLPLLFLIARGSNTCTKQSDLACCKETCPFCGPCNYLNGSYSDFEEDCCSNIILISSLYCNVTAPPCILQIQMNNLERIFNFFKTKPLYIVIPVAVGMGLLCLFCLYSCCIFGVKEPPLKYKKIVERLPQIS
jgi:hypothetical protein